MDSPRRFEDTPEQGSPSVEQGESSDGADPPAPAYQLALADHDREYGCRYCHKKFSNKQALGGHQNAHKVERAMEKNVQETGGISYYDDDPNPYPYPYPYPARMNAPAPFLGSSRHQDFLHRTSLFSWRGGSGGVVAYNPRPCSASAPPARPHYMLPGHDGNVRLPNFGPGSSGFFRVSS
ncbi:zinc finger protein 7-like [Salvia miltiorrhiza]|uniref:zinc finger protein 7-like n=1 Tax=Salvia miltiorrhiza TaxID=226208 RepID=UPI0025AD886E|nr:zinc finger protein 7-like [Salvia miltiorrhiza]